MKKILLLILIAAFTTSCATIFNKKTYEVYVSSNESNSKVQVYDSVYNLPNKIKVIRSSQDLKIKLIKDSTEVNYTVKSSPNSEFLFLNLLGFQLAPINYAIDFTNNKRFYYGKIIRLNSNDTIRKIEPPIKRKWNNYFSKKYPRSKKDFNLIFSIPYANGYYFKPIDFGRKSNTGFWGISAGLEYFYKDNKYLSLQLVTATDLFTPVPAPITLGEEREDLSTTYIEFTDNYKFGRLNLGYGLNYSLNNWELINETNPNDPIRISRTNRSFGITTNAYFELAEGLFMGVIYRPTFYNIHPKSKFEYEHFISLDFAFKIPLRRK